MFPGKIAIKKSAAARPTHLRKGHKTKRPKPSEISTIPDAITTKSGLSGNQVGTWA
jgi:hypothetical protein